MTPEQLAMMLAMLKVDVGVLSATAYDERFRQLLRTAAESITKEGAALDFTSYDTMQTVVMYAAWLWRRRDSMESMGRGLRLRVNNLVLATKAAAPEG